MFAKINHVAIVSDNYAQLAQFYEAVFGMKTSAKTRPGRAVTVGGARSEGLLVSRGLNGSERVVAIAGAFLRTGETVAIAGKAS